jgi:hypothetical protein
MSDKPIIFSSEMVRAILDGRKTQTRRVVRPQPEEKPCGWPPELNKLSWYWKNEYIGIPINLVNYCPYDSVGDLLWVREKFAYLQNPEACFKEGEFPDVAYWAGGNWDEAEPDQQPEWKPSIYMPKWATRIWLKITNIRVERVQDITLEDVVAEGVRLEGEDYMRAAFGVTKKGILECLVKPVFRNLWNSLNAKRGYSWESNPWVWVIEFKIKDLQIRDYPKGQAS